MTGMRAKLLVAGSALLFGLVSTPARASDTDIFASCDGLGKPGKSPAGMSSPADTARYSEYSGGAWKSVVTACDAALAHEKLLPTQGLRRAHLLRGRAMAYARGRELEKALKDIEDAGAAASTVANDPLYLRSFAVSLDLLQALIYDQMGKNDEALRLARQSAAARPFATEVQRVAAHLLLTHRQQDDSAKATIQSANRLDPDFIFYQTGFLASLGDFKAVAELEIPPLVPIEVSDDKKAPPSALDNMTAVRAQLQSRLTLSYARAATGDVERARSDLAQAKSDYAAFQAAVSPAVREQVQTIVFTPGLDLIASYEPRINARIALAEGRRPAAEALVNDKKFPLDSVTTDLFSAMQDKAALPSKTPSAVSEFAAAQLTGMRKRMFDAMVRLAEVAPETAKTNSVYKRSRPNVLGALASAAVTMGISLLQGVDKTDGFAAKENSDGSVRVSLTGATPAPAVVREMTLLRAAEFALENGKPAFVIVARDDYARYQTTSYQGREIGRVPTGYKSDIVVRFLDADANNARAFDAKTIVDSLGPYYYKDDKK